MNGGPIQVCPVCNYDLQTLPRNYRCPECGFEYEESMRVWNVNYPKIMKVINFGVMPTIGLMMFALFLKFGSGKMKPIMMIGPTIMLLQPLTIALFLRGKMRGFIVTGRDGITFRYGFRQPKFRPWHQVRLNNSIWTADLVTGSPTLPTYLPIQFLRGEERTELRAEIIRRLNAFYVPPLPSPRVEQSDGPT